MRVRGVAGLGRCWRCGVWATGGAGETLTRGGKAHLPPFRKGYVTFLGSSETNNRCPHSGDRLVYVNFETYPSKIVLSPYYYYDTNLS